MRWLLCLVMAASIAAFIALVSLNGIGQIAAKVGTIGWGFGLLILLRLAALGLAGLGWAAASTPVGPVRIPVFLGLRLVREGVNCLLPVAQVGGDMIGGRLLTRFGFGVGPAMATILADLFLQAATQGLFAALGLVCLWHAMGDAPVVREAGAFVLIAIPLLAGFFLAQRFGLFLLVDRALGLFNRVFQPNAAGKRLDLQPALVAIYGDRRRLALATLLHLAGWLMGVAEMWATLLLIGLPARLPECLIIESLAQALRSAAFGVPGALGVQEGGLIVLGGLFGIPAASAIAVSIAKRLPDIAIGLPGVAAWQYLELSVF
jgi:putative membrane protein